MAVPTHGQPVFVLEDFRTLPAELRADELRRAALRATHLYVAGRAGECALACDRIVRLSRVLGDDLAADMTRGDQRELGLIAQANKTWMSATTGCVAHRIVLRVRHRATSSEDVSIRLADAAAAFCDSAARCLGNAVAVLHGSAADGTMTGFSDLDLALICPDRYFLMPAGLRQLKRHVASLDSVLLTLDPLCHHGTLVLPESSLLQYDESMLPIRAWESAVCVSGQTPLSFALRPCRYDAARRLRRHSLALSAPARGPFNVRLKLARIMLMPALFMQALHGHFVDKRESLEMCASFMCDDSVKAVKHATELRRAWSRADPPASLSSELESLSISMGLECLDQLTESAECIAEADRQSIAAQDS